MEFYPDPGEGIDRRADIDSISAEAIKLCYDKHVSFFEPIEKAAKLGPLPGGDASRDRFRDDPIRPDGETGGPDLSDLILGGLLDRRDAGI